MRTKQTNDLTYKRDPIDLTATAAGDYVLYRFTKKWYSVVRLVRVNGNIHVDCLDEKGNSHRFVANECYPTWNPRTQSFGREKGSTRKSYWLP